MAVDSKALRSPLLFVCHSVPCTGSLCTPRGTPDLRDYLSGGGAESWERPTVAVQTRRPLPPSSGMHQLGWRKTSARCSCAVMRIETSANARQSPPRDGAGEAARPMAPPLREASFTETRSFPMMIGSDNANNASRIPKSLVY